MTSQKINSPIPNKVLLLNNKYRRFKSFFKQLYLEYKYLYLHVLKIIRFVLYNGLGHKLYEINCFVDMLHVGFEILCKSLH